MYLLGAGKPLGPAPARECSAAYPWAAAGPRGPRDGRQHDVTRATTAADAFLQPLPSPLDVLGAPQPMAGFPGAQALITAPTKPQQAQQRRQQQQEPPTQEPWQARGAGPQQQQQQQRRPRVHQTAGRPRTNPDLRAALDALIDPSKPVSLPPSDLLCGSALDNRALDKLVATLGRSHATWRRALVLFEWLKEAGHDMDDRLCTTLIRVCADHGQAATALGIYEWMRAPSSAGGGCLVPTVYTYTAAMRAALSAGLLDRAQAVWDDARTAGCPPDCRLATSFVEVCTKRGATDQALSIYEAMRAAPPGAPLAPTVHAYTAAMRAATEGGRWGRALEIWGDMEAAGVAPTAHAYAAGITACAAGGDWRRAVELFERMCNDGVSPDVVSCTALITALGAGGQWQRAEAVVRWMLDHGVRPNVRTYTALLSALGGARQWDRAAGALARMTQPEWGGVAPNAYTYSALIKCMGEHGEVARAEALFTALESRVRGAAVAEAAAAAADGASVVAAAQEAGRAAGLPTGALWAWASTDSGDSTATTTAGGVGGVKDAAAERVSGADWTSAAQLNGLNLQLGSSSGSSPALGVAPSQQQQQPSHSWPQAPWGTAAAEGAATTSGGQGGTDGSRRQQQQQQQQQQQSAPDTINEVVCGALMMAYDRAGKWREAAAVLSRATALGVTPNTVMYNTAIGAAARARQPDAAEALFAAATAAGAADAATHESLVAAHGMVGDPIRAEAAFAAMTAAGLRPREYAYCALVAAHSLAGDAAEALRVRARMRRAGGRPGVHMYNALIAACDRGAMFERALDLLRSMRRDGVAGNALTARLAASVGRKGAATVENQQLTAAALSAALAAAGSLLIRSGVF